MILKFFRIYLN